MPKAEAAAPKQYPSDRIETHPARMAEEPPPYEAVPDGADDEIEL